MSHIQNLTFKVIKTRCNSFTHEVEDFLKNKVSAKCKNVTHRHSSYSLSACRDKYTSYFFLFLWFKNG